MFSSISGSAKHFKASHNTNLLNLPDLVLYHICRCFSSPFDLLNFGNSCTKLRRISSNHSLWYHLAIRWFSGLWHIIDLSPLPEDPRSWLLTLLHHIEMKIPNTKCQCHFQDTETWTRADTHAFRCMLGMLQLAYIDKLKEFHPGVLYERWLFDIGIYRRAHPCIHFESPNIEFSKEDFLELSSLGQAKERDLRARKQPYINPMYYIKVRSSSTDFVVDLFPHNTGGSICPLLLCPFQDAISTEVSGISGLLTCLTLVLEKHIVTPKKIIPPSQITKLVKSAIDGFLKFWNDNLEAMRRMWNQYYVSNAIRNLAVENTFDLSSWQATLDGLGINVRCKHLMMEVHNLIVELGGIDLVVDDLRGIWRKALVEEIQTVLLPEESGANKLVTRINLTDSDLIGGDNRRQEMSAAAFISQYGVLVTWHLIGRLRY